VELRAENHSMWDRLTFLGAMPTRRNRPRDRGGAALSCRRLLSRRGVFATVSAAVILAGRGGAAGQCQYEVVQLDYPIDCSIAGVITIATGLNNHGAVVGRYKCAIWNTVLGFLWTPEEGYKTLPLPPDVNSMRADGINDAGAIVGSYSLPGGGSRAFVYQDGQYTELLPPPGSNYIRAYAVDNEGMVAGAHSLGANPSQPSAYVWTAQEGFTYLGVMNGPYSKAGYIGPAGHVTGWTGNNIYKQGFVWHQGQLMILPPIPGGATSGAGAITADGLLVGSGRTKPSGPDVITVGFLWRDGGFLRFIDPLPGYDTSGAGYINGARQVTGLSVSLANPDDRRGFLWQHGVTHDLNALVPPGTSWIERAGDINEHGQIIATGFGGHSFLLTPGGRPPGDLDIDCAVGVTDFLRLLAEWGQPDSPADINKDGTVDGLDLAILFDNWG
jgi:probable HAF family extracellular repeat protein